MIGILQTQQDPEQPYPVRSALSRRLDKVCSRGLFQPKGCTSGLKCSPSSYHCLLGRAAFICPLVLTVICLF